MTDVHVIFQLPTSPVHFVLWDARLSILDVQLFLLNLQASNQLSSNHEQQNIFMTTQKNEAFWKTETTKETWGFWKASQALEARKPSLATFLGEPKPADRCPGQTAGALMSYTDCEQGSLPADSSDSYQLRPRSVPGESNAPYQLAARLRSSWKQ